MHGIFIILYHSHTPVYFHKVFGLFLTTQGLFKYISCVSLYIKYITECEADKIMKMSIRKLTNKPTPFISGNDSDCTNRHLAQISRRSHKAHLYHTSFPCTRCLQINKFVPTRFQRQYNSIRIYTYIYIYHIAYRYTWNVYNMRAVSRKQLKHTSSIIVINSVIIILIFNRVHFKRL